MRRSDSNDIFQYLLAKNTNAYFHELEIEIADLSDRQGYPIYIYIFALLQLLPLPRKYIFSVERGRIARGPRVIFPPDFYDEGRRRQFITVLGVTLSVENDVIVSIIVHRQRLSIFTCE